MTRLMKTSPCQSRSHRRLLMQRSPPQPPTRRRDLEERAQTGDHNQRILRPLPTHRLQNGWQRSWRRRDARKHHSPRLDLRLPSILRVARRASRRTSRVTSSPAIVVGPSVGPSPKSHSGKQREATIKTSNAVAHGENGPCLAGRAQRAGLERRLDQQKMATSPQGQTLDKSISTESYHLSPALTNGKSPRPPQKTKPPPPNHPFPKATLQT